LLEIGKERLTTTRVAKRAGVSVGTLYQYFPNKSALLQAVLKRHLSRVTEAVERTCADQRGQSLKQMATAVITTFLAAKMTDVKRSVAVYAVASDLDGARITRYTGSRSNKAMVEMLKTAKEQLTTDPQLIASMLQGAMVGVSRRLLESSAPEKQLDSVRRELVFFACAYLDACTVRSAARA
jgi:AcrR family transcriptional regulator